MALFQWLHGLRGCRSCSPPRSCCQSLLVVAIQAKATDSSRNKEINSQPSKNFRFYSVLFPNAPRSILEEKMSFGNWFQKGLNLRFHWDHKFWTHTGSHLHQQLSTCQVIVMVWEDLRQLFIHQQDVPAQEKIKSLTSLASTLKSNQVSVSFSSIIDSSTYKGQQNQNASSEMLHISWEPWWDVLVLPVKLCLIWQQTPSGLWTVCAAWEWVGD